LDRAIIKKIIFSGSHVVKIAIPLSILTIIFAFLGLEYISNLIFGSVILFFWWYLYLSRAPIILSTVTGGAIGFFTIFIAFLLRHKLDGDSIGVCMGP